MFHARGIRHVHLGVILLVLVLLTAAGCGRQLLSVVLDLPPPEEGSVVMSNVAPPMPQVAPADTVRPPIEYTLDPDSARTYLPRDHAGNIDWVAALRTGVIRPKNRIPGDQRFDDVQDFRFGFDFFFPGPAPMFDAYFPHSVHTEWVACQQCHPRIFKYRDTDIKMADVLSGKYCGECHGRVSFPPATACERCHQELAQPPDRAQPDLLGTFRLIRASQPVDTTKLPASTADSSAVATASKVVFSTDDLPPAVFPHWIHRVRFTCKVCHTQIFEPRLGANDISMADISAGEDCGRCHDGTTAFDAGFGNCQRCHQPFEADAGTSAASPNPP